MTTTAAIIIKQISFLAEECEYCKQNICMRLELDPKKVWEVCEEHLSQKPIEVIDHRRGINMLQWLKQHHVEKFRLLRAQLHFSSEGSLIAFSRRVFGCTPNQARKDFEGAKEFFDLKFAKLTAQLNGILELESPDAESKNKSAQKKIDLSVPKTKPENQTRKPNPKTKPENQTRKPKKKLLGKRKIGK
jgi:hypothetical protein